MHCYGCGQVLEVTPGTTNLPVYDMSIQVYRNEQAVCLECPSCRALIVIINYQAQEIEMIVIDKSLESH